MRVAISCWSVRAPFPNFLAARLRSLPGVDGIVVLRVKRPLARVAREALDKYGVQGLAQEIPRRLVRRGSSGGRSELEVFRELATRAAASLGLPDWQATLSRAAEGVQILSTRNINSTHAVALVTSSRPDLLFNCGGGIFREPLIRALPLGILNPHMGELPRFRGMNALEWSLFHCRRPQVTIHRIDPGIDTGDILAVRTVPLEPSDTIASARARASLAAADALVEVFADMRDGKAKRVPQRPGEGRQFYVMHPRLLSVSARNVGLVAGAPR